MDLESAARDWRADGFVILPEFIPAEELAAAVSELGLLFHTNMTPYGEIQLQPDRRLDLTDLPPL